jgi:hypothetical protein
LANRPVTAVAYNSRCETSTFETEVGLRWMVFMDVHVATAPRVLLVLPTDTGDENDDYNTSTGTESGTTAAGGASSISETGSDGGSGEGRSGSAGGLSTGAKVAIGVVVPIVVMLVVALLWFFIRRHKKRAITKFDALAQDPSPPPVASIEDAVVIKAELPASTDPPGVAFQKPELEGSHQHHAPSMKMGDVHEMLANPIDSATSELDTTMVAGSAESPAKLVDK